MSTQFTKTIEVASNQLRWISQALTGVGKHLDHLAADRRDEARVEAIRSLQKSLPIVLQRVEAYSQKLSSLSASLQTANQERTPEAWKQLEAEATEVYKELNVLYEQLFGFLHSVNRECGTRSEAVYKLHPLTVRDDPQVTSEADRFQAYADTESLSSLRDHMEAIKAQRDSVSMTISSLSCLARALGRVSQ